MPWMHRHSHLLRYVHALKALCALPKSSRPMKDSCGKTWQVREYSHSFSSLHKLAKVIFCSSGLGRAPGQRDYFFPGFYTPITLSALSFNKVENPKSKQRWKPSSSIWFGMQPIFVCLCSSPTGNLWSLLRNWVPVRPWLLLELLRMQRYFCLMTQPYLFLLSLRSLYIYAQNTCFGMRTRADIKILFNKRFQIKLLAFYNSNSLPAFKI